MPEPLAIPDDDILVRLRSRFDLDADAVEFLPLGYDAQAWVYWVHAGDGDRFLKIRRGSVNEAGLAVPQLLAARGIPHLAPIPTTTGALFDDGDLAFILFPFVEGESGGEAGMSAAQWAELGATMRAIHDLPPRRRIRLEPAHRGLRACPHRDAPRGEERIDSPEHDDDPARLELAGFFRSHRDQMERLVWRTEALAPVEVRGGRGPQGGLYPPPLPPSPGGTPQPVA